MKTPLTAEISLTFIDSVKIGNVRNFHYLCTR